MNMTWTDKPQEDRMSRIRESGLLKLSLKSWNDGMQMNSSSRGSKFIARCLCRSISYVSRVSINQRIPTLIKTHIYQSPPSAILKSCRALIGYASG